MLHQAVHYSVRRRAVGSFLFIEKMVNKYALCGYTLSPPLINYVLDNESSSKKQNTRIMASFAD